MVRRRQCIIPGCVEDVDDETKYESMGQALKAMEIHQKSHELSNAVPVLNQPGGAHVQSQSRIPKSNSPMVEMWISN